MRTINSLAMVASVLNVILEVVFYTMLLRVPMKQLRSLWNCLTDISYQL